MIVLGDIRGPWYFNAHWRQFGIFLGYRPIGFVSFGWDMSSGNFGIYCAWKRRKAVRQGERQFERTFSLTLISREGWIDCGWLALWPIHFQYRHFSIYDPEIWDRELLRPRTPTTPIWARRWTGRSSLITGITISVSGHLWIWTW